MEDSFPESIIFDVFNDLQQNGDVELAFGLQQSFHNPGQYYETFANEARFTKDQIVANNLTSVEFFDKAVDFLVAWALSIPHNSTVIMRMLPKYQILTMPCGDVYVRFRMRAYLC